MRALCFLIITALIFPSVVAAQDPRTTVRLSDRSDWWSILNENFRWPDEKDATQEIGADNFEIAGVNLQSDPIVTALKKFGQTVGVRRGDASNGRIQLCYMSDGKAPVDLIFEQGQLNISFYMFAEDHPWNGEAVCAVNPQVTSVLRTKSGLGLGLSPAEVQGILGKPDYSDATTLAYQREIKKHNSDERLAQLRKEHADMSDEDFHDSYAEYDLDQFIEARFTDGKLTYLAVSWAESY